jgi:hypothetical protein
MAQALSFLKEGKPSDRVDSEFIREFLNNRPDAYSRLVYNRVTK